MRNKLSKVLRGLFLGFFFLSIITACNKEEQAKKATPPTIQVVEVLQKDVPIYEYFVGQVYGKEDININARVEGFLTGIHFEEGSRVRKGTLLYSIDPEPFKAAIASERSKVAQAQTLLVNAENELARYKPLAEIDAVSQSDLDFAQANRDASIASVRAAKASLRMAEINLSYTKVKSPITGFIGKTLARVGEFVGRSPNPVILNTVSTIESVRVQLYITESQYLALAREYSLHRDGSGDTQVEERTPNLTLILSDESVHPYMGVADFVNREIDSQTGALLVQGSFPNPDLILRPGQFSRVKVKIKDAKGALLVPQRCVKEIQGQYSIFIVNNDNKVESRQITVEERVGDLYLVGEGLQPGEQVVIDALQKVRTGITVNPEKIEFDSKTSIEE
jgi:membrane fusion protein (multidrug efflux system)